MNRHNILVCLLCLSFMMSISEHCAASHPEKTISRAWKHAHKIWTEATGNPVDTDPNSNYYSEFDTVFSLQAESGDQIGFMIVSSAKGRFDLFDFVVLYDLDLQIIGLRVLTYRSEYGSQVSSRGWLKQFTGPPPTTGFKYGQNIDAISGATFSAVSFTAQMNRLNLLIAELQE